MTSIPNDGKKQLNLGEDEQTGKRRLENWIDSFAEWALPRTDSPSAYVFWSGIYTIAAALRRQVKISEKHLGSWECFPHLYLMFVGPPGMRKTTSMTSFSAKLLTQVPGLRKGPSFFTKELITQQMIETPDTSVYLMVGEFGDLMQKNKPGEMYDFLTSMYDNKESLEVGTMMRGVQVGLRPSLNMFSATTPAWISENMSAGVIGGGFASRVIFIYEERLRAPRLIYTTRMKERDDGQLEKDLLHDLIEISNLAGEVELDEGMEDYLNEWNDRHASSPPVDARFAGYHSRKPMMILKLAIIHSVSKGNSLLITKEDFDWAVRALESTEAQLGKIFGGVGENRFVFDMDAITGFVLTRGEVAEEEILAQFRSVAEPNKLMELLRGCIQCGDLLFKQVGTTRYYFAND